MKRPFFILAATLALSGCVDGWTHKEITVLTPGVVGAECMISTHDNKYRAVTPQVILVQKPGDPLEVECRKPYYRTALVEIPAPYPDTISVALEQDPEAIAAGAVVSEPPPAPLEKRDFGKEAAPVPVADPVPAAAAISKTLRK